MFTNQQALDACRTIRPFLPQLLPSDLAKDIDQQLADLLNQERLEENEKVDRLLVILNSHEATKAWVENFLSFVSVRYHTRSDNSYAGLPGDPSLQTALRYVCPEKKDYIWYREGDDEIPLCPTHLVRLVLEPK